MIKRDELVSYLQKFLECEKFKDYAPNGLQVEGKLNISKICTAVTASEDAIVEAVASGADLLLVHHGYFWKGEKPTITGMMRRRLGLLMEHDINLCAYHLPLDSHAQVGNNACLATLLKVQNTVQHEIDSIPGIMWSGDLSQSVTVSDFTKVISKILQKPITLFGGNDEIKTIAWCTGAGQDFIEYASDIGVDAYLSGEISERTYYQSQELKINYFSCGHHATERFGIQSLGEHLATKFNLNHQFIDSNNPI
ncbi:MAG: Nif3-like dinuclear metal center hexameric protein [Legionellaceae bacterium]|nr:Nif3-like dinuclear metal center hexameric protein [Legionellaceae bacterium]